MKRTLKQRKENSEGKKGNPISLYEIDGDGKLNLIVGEAQHIRDESDVETVLEEINFEGRVYPMRPVLKPVFRGKSDDIVYKKG